ncbi:hypothetical protein ACT2FY_00795 [Paraburkholderia fungorum]|uniref:hypothetical protein n=1 Tax=Paraburkholderia fungorum TaxID=134537 RepID=UPI00402B4D61
MKRWLVGYSCVALLAALGARGVHAADDSADAAATAPANPAFSASLEVWTYGSHADVKNASVLNLGNAVARLPDYQAIFDPRLDLQGRWNTDWGQADAEVDPRWSVMYGHVDCPPGCASSTFSGPVTWDQAFARVRSADTTVVLGRELLTWGPATFRSPSNPFYFDADRTDPLADTPGIDLVRATQAWGNVKLTGVYVFSTGTLYPAISRADGSDSTLLKLDKQGDNYLVSVVASQRRGDAPFVGGFAQLTPDDAWLVYGEWNSSIPEAQWLPGSDGHGPLLTLNNAPARAWTGLFGASYTFASGQVAGAEYLYNGHGYGSADETRFFGQAATAAALVARAPGFAYGTLGEALAQSSTLLGRHYVWLGLQSNPQETRQYWRLESATNLQDHSCQLTAYYERNLLSRLSAFVSVTVNIGSARSEFGALFDNRLTIGLKTFVF